MKGERESFMDIDAVLNYFATYGLTLLFVIVFLEYLNIPGLPAGIIMPAAGILASRNNQSIVLVVFISVVAGVFLCRLLPVLRTIVSIIAGSVRMNFFKFLIYSTPGIFLWNLGFIFTGYFFGDVFLK